MRLIRMKIKCDNFLFSFCANAFHGTDSLWVPFGDGGWAGSGGYGVSREFQLRNDKVSGQQQSLSHKKKSFLWGVNKTSALSLSLSLSHFLGIFAFCVLGIFLKPQVAWLHPTRENLAKTTRWGSLYLPPSVATKSVYKFDLPATPSTIRASKKPSLNILTLNWRPTKPGA